MSGGLSLTHPDAVIWSPDDHRFVGWTSPRLSKKRRRELEDAERREITTNDEDGK